MLLSVDGAMVPLVGGDWAEVKTLVLGALYNLSDDQIEYQAAVLHHRRTRRR